MTSVVVLGGTGMLGHKIFQRLAGAGFNAHCTARGALTERQRMILTAHGEERVDMGLDAHNFGRFADYLNQTRPFVVVNCVGIVKQRPEAQQPLEAIALNALFPHQVAGLIGAWGGRLVHFSTDCVFRGDGGPYLEHDMPDADDLYGKTKALGEISDRENTLTIRTSIIGREIGGKRSLLEWFLSHSQGSVRGFRQHLYSGVTTNYLADVVLELIRSFPHLRGLHQIASEPISKYQLLLHAARVFGSNVQVEADDSTACNRVLDGTRFREATGLCCPSWPDLLTTVRDDPTPYVHQLTR